MSSENIEHTIVMHMVTMMCSMLSMVTDYEERLQHANALILYCHNHGISTNARLMTHGGIMLLIELLLLYRHRLHGGSATGKSPNIQRQREEAFQRLLQDYFEPHPTYSPVKFRRRFRMGPSLFHRVRLLRDAKVELITRLVGANDRVFGYVNESFD